MSEIDTEIIDEARVDFDEDQDFEYEETSVVVREVLERQLIASRELSTRIVEATTEAAAALAMAPAAVIAGVRDGATLPDALGQAADALYDTTADAGSRIRATVSSYVNSQSALPHAVIIGAADVAASMVRAQGAVTVSAVDTAFTIATVATRGGDIRDALDQEWRELSASAISARGEITDAVGHARQSIRVVLP